MRFRFTLSHDVLGSLEITEPDGWKDAVLKLERDKNFHSLIEYFDGSFIFYGNDGVINGGIDFIREVERDYGFDADLNILIEISVDGYTYETVFIGLLKLDAIQEMQDNKLQVPIVRNDFWSKFINRLDTPVDLQSDLSLDNESVDQFNNINLTLTSQKIQKTTSYTGEFLVPSNAGTMPATEIDASGAIDGPYDFFSTATLNTDQEEIKDAFQYPFSIETSSASIFEQIKLADESGDMVVSGIIDFIVLFSGGILQTSTEADPSNIDLIQCSISVRISVNGVDVGGLGTQAEDYAGPFGPYVTGVTEPIQFTFDPFSFSGSDSFPVEVGDEVRVYIEYNIETLVDVGADTGSREWTGRAILIDDFSSEIDFTMQSVYRDTDASAFLLHDVAGQITDRIINRNETFYSEYLGSENTVYRQYDQDGCGWKYSLVKGLQLRQYTLIEKPFFQSFKTWWDGANPILNLGLGYEEIDGQEVVRVEEKEHFYDDDISLLIDNVRQIRRVYDPERIFKTVKIGYKQWQSENISGIDDPQTKRTYASRLQKAGTDLTLESDFIAASLAIETTRRTTREKSADYKFDNETFIIAINPTPVDVSPETSPDVNDYAPELDENFSSVTNLLNSETRYNLRITPARNLIRWLAYISGALQSYLSSAFKFTAGEGNYDMASDMANTSDGCDEYKAPLSEKQDIQVYSDPLHLALLYEITIPMEWEEYVTIRDNRKKAIGISQTDQNHVTFFIKELSYEVTKSQATITAWPKELIEIEVIEYNPAMVECIPRTTFPLTVDSTTITVDSTEYTVDATEYTI